ncbi:MAG: zinc-dependent metalloprotease [Chroococcidiopsidaceae cyanobacterium CP_BM_ER_R8_30]|nr:zinc-dependent metalloprotease [Chroococcidiopsidaceae cyanobacterium CP_BM_ER_R8_30]
MKKLPFYITLLCGLFLGLILHSLFLTVKPAAAHLPLSAPSQLELARLEAKGTQKLDSQLVVRKLENSDRQSEPDEPDSKDSEPSELQPFAQVIKNTEKMEGLFTLYRNQATGKIYLEIKPDQLNKNYLSTVTMESGIGERGVYSGMPLQDLLFYFQRVNNNLQFVVRNENFRTLPGDPQARSLARSFSDSVLYSLSIKSVHQERQSILVDLGDLLLADVPNLSSQLSSLLQGSYQLDDKKSYFGAAKVFPFNLEIESVYGFSSGSGDRQSTALETVPDSRDLTVRVHYGFSQLPQNDGYSPRLADDRVGYFITAYEDFSNDNHDDPFVRYINRWHLEKQDPSSPLSPPQHPIMFWIENAVPLEYRDAIREGVLMWNQAFERLGFKDAIQVQQMPDDAKWDPADVRYNTIRWLNTVDGFFALGPARVNPLTGEILSADIIVDGSFVRALKQEYRTIVQQNQLQPQSLLSYVISGSLGANNSQTFHICTNKQGGQIGESRQDTATSATSVAFLSQLATRYDLCYGMETSNQLAVGSVALSLFQDIKPSSEQMQAYIHQYLRLIIAHEVGHTLGLRHNFRGSTLLPPEDLNNTEITHTKGLVTSVMDYIPPNLAPQGVKQGDYFPSVIGPYDEWAIEYGYKPSGAAAPDAELPFLKEIAQLSTQAELDYATDEDMFDIDPNVNPWDNSSNVLLYSQWQLDNDRAMWSRLNQNPPMEGESYNKLSRMFDTVFFHYLQNTYFITKYIAGQSFHREHIGDSNGQLPFAPVPVEQQRQALATLQKYIFAADAFQFPPELLNKLAPSRWMDWGNQVQTRRLDYPIHDSIFLLQSLVLKELLSGDRLDRLGDLELKSQPGQALSIAELFDSLQDGIFSEVMQPNRQLQPISSLRGALQSQYLNLLTNMVLRNVSVPEAARTLAWYKLNQLRSLLSKIPSHSRHLDEYTLAHLAETRDRIDKALNAQLQSK